MPVSPCCRLGDPLTDGDELRGGARAHRGMSAHLALSNRRLRRLRAEGDKCRHHALRASEARTGSAESCGHVAQYCVSSHG